MMATRCRLALLFFFVIYLGGVVILLLWAHLTVVIYWKPNQKVESNELRSIAGKETGNDQTSLSWNRLFYRSQHLQNRIGPGENGTAVELGGANISWSQILVNNEKHRFNTFISDMISLQRRLPDMRPTACKARTYSIELPPVGIVIIFRDELPSILLRTVYSVLQMSPPKLIKEIILVDDGSVDNDLKAAVRIHALVLEKVRIVRHSEPRGLMMARQSGVNNVTADYFVILDGHMEVGPGWLEPLIARLFEQPNTLLCSHVGSIDKETFGYQIGFGHPDTCTFQDAFPFFDHITLDQMFAYYKHSFRESRNCSVEPIPYGTVQGMMIVMKKTFFQELGGFDPGMKVWGSEQIELSVKVWMCGGTVEMVPCSTVAHMYRSTPWANAEPDNDFHILNKARMVKVWMDPPYNEIISDFLGDKLSHTGNISQRVAIRTANKCNSYQYFVDKIRTFSDVYIPTKKNIVARGRVLNMANNHCLDVARDERTREYYIIQYHCHEKIAANQYFIFTDKHMIRSRESLCIFVDTRKDNTTVGVQYRSEEWGKSYMQWTYTNGQLTNIFTATCLTAKANNRLTMESCDSDRDEQIWKWEHL